MDLWWLGGTRRPHRLFTSRSGCNHGDRVVLWMENCAEMLELMLACWTAGLCVVPVNARLHPREVAHIVTILARLLMTTPGLFSDARAVSGAQQDRRKLFA